jgi:hypothetical protein
LQRVNIPKILLAGKGIYNALKGLQPKAESINNSSQNKIIVKQDISQLPVDTYIPPTGTRISVLASEWERKNLQGMNLRNAYLDSLIFLNLKSKMVRTVLF